jgi:hypothetical protein
MLGAASSVLRAGSAAAALAAATASSAKGAKTEKDKSREALLFGGRR